MTLLMQIRAPFGIYGLTMINLCKAEHFHFPRLQYFEDYYLGLGKEHTSHSAFLC